MHLILKPIIGLCLVGTLLFSNVNDGHKIYLTKFQHECGLSALEFTQQHTQEEWSEIYNENNFQEEVFLICPNLDREIKTKYVSYLYDFVYMYAKGSGNLPNH